MDQLLVFLPLVAVFLLPGAHVGLCVVLHTVLLLTAFVMSGDAGGPLFVWLVLSPAYVFLLGHSLIKCRTRLVGSQLPPRRRGTSNVLVIAASAAAFAYIVWLSHAASVQRLRVVFFAAASEQRSAIDRRVNEKNEALLDAARGGSAADTVAELTSYVRRLPLRDGLFLESVKAGDNPGDTATIELVLRSQSGEVPLKMAWQIPIYLK